MKKKEIKTIGDLGNYINTNKLKISEWDSFKSYMIDNEIKAVGIRYLQKTLPKHWSKKLSYIINYILLLDKGVIVNEGEN